MNAGVNIMPKENTPTLVSISCIQEQELTNVCVTAASHIL
jgi:hypothetical protein